MNLILPIVPMLVMWLKFEFRAMVLHRSIQIAYEKKNEKQSDIVFGLECQQTENNKTLKMSRWFFVATAATNTILWLIF